MKMSLKEVRLPATLEWEKEGLGFGMSSGITEV